MADAVRLGTVFFAFALQRGDVTTVTAVTFMLELLVPSLLGVLLFGDHLSLGSWVGIALVVLGVVTLNRA